MKGNMFNYLKQLFQRRNKQPIILPKQGENPTKKGFGLSVKERQRRRKALRMRQKMARRANRG